MTLDDFRRVHCLKQCGFSLSEAVNAVVNDNQLDRYTALATRLFNVPISFVNIIDDRHVIMKSQSPLDLLSAPNHCTDRCDSFCDKVIADGAPDVLVVRDALADPKYAEKPLVAKYNIRFYAGAALFVDNVKVGTLCIFDHAPRSQFSVSLMANLLDLAASVSMLFQARKTTGMRSRLDNIHSIEHLVNFLEEPIARLQSCNQVVEASRLSGSATDSATGDSVAAKAELIKLETLAARTKALLGPPVTLMASSSNLLKILLRDTPAQQPKQIASAPMIKGPAEVADTYHHQSVHQVLETAKKTLYDYMHTPDSKLLDGFATLIWSMDNAPILQRSQHDFSPDLLLYVLTSVLSDVVMKWGLVTVHVSFEQLPVAERRDWQESQPKGTIHGQLLVLIKTRDISPAFMSESEDVANYTYSVEDLTSSFNAAIKVVVTKNRIQRQRRSQNQSDAASFSLASANAEQQRSTLTGISYEYALPLTLSTSEPTQAAHVFANTNDASTSKSVGNGAEDTVSVTSATAALSLDGSSSALTTAENAIEVKKNSSMIRMNSKTSLTVDIKGFTQPITAAVRLPINPTVPTSAVPSKSSEPPPSTAAVTSNGSTSQRKLEVVVVEDTLSIQKVLKKWFTANGCNVAIAENGKIGLGLLKTNKYDLMCIDFLMPVQLGLTTMKLFSEWLAERQREGSGALNKNMIVVGMSATASIDEQEEGFNYCMNFYVSKPSKNSVFSAVLDAIRAQPDSENNFDKGAVLDDIEVRTGLTKSGIVVTKENADPKVNVIRSATKQL